MADACMIQRHAPAQDSPRLSSRTRAMPIRRTSHAPPPHPTTTVTTPPIMPIWPLASSAQPLSIRNSLDKPKTELAVTDVRKESDDHGVGKESSSTSKHR